MHDRDNDLLTIAEAAELVRCPVATLRYWRHVGGGPCRSELADAFVTAGTTFTSGSRPSVMPHDRTLRERENVVRALLPEPGSDSAHKLWARTRLLALR